MKPFDDQGDLFDLPRMDRQLNRRQFLQGAAALGASAGLGLIVPASVLAATQPKRGGLLKLGMGGGNTTDLIDPTLLPDWVPLNQAYMLMNGLVEIDVKMRAQPELLESWKAKPGAAEWILKVRKGVVFHNGKTLDADDVIYSINLHRGDASKSAIKSSLEDVTEITKIDPLQISMKLKSGNADLPYLLVVPNGFKDWSHLIGTGPFVFGEFTPGVRSLFKRNPHYWKPDAAYVDAVELIVINDATARTNALISGQVHAINRVDFKTVDLLKRSPAVNIVRSAGGQHFTFLMDCAASPFADNNVRLAVKYGIDRQKQLTTILRGYGSIGNDHPILKTDRFYAADLPQHAYDPDKSKFYLKKAGLSELKVELSTSDAVFAGAVDSAALFQGECVPAGIQLSIRRQPADSYWDKVWMQAPFCMGYWGGRPTADQMLSTAYKSDAKWNDTHWRDPRFDALLLQARAMLDDTKHRELYREMQS
ncbi:MAG: ABC transporter, substrate-binding protein (cluster 5, nickel/peptides/opines) [uncultured Caballeronia sp.]|nr:MAG: ABC transporter, substrate-binding protein (cluster 5, nickel/peptides/opines) [uncultured Caballeronia sp.]